jgi:hypothetical protein
LHHEGKLPSKERERPTPKCGDGTAGEQLNGVDASFPGLVVVETRQARLIGGQAEVEETTRDCPTPAEASIGMG